MMKRSGGLPLCLVGLVPYVICGCMGWCYIHWPKQTLGVVMWLALGPIMPVVVGIGLVAAIYHLAMVYKLVRSWVEPKE